MFFDGDEQISSSSNEKIDFSTNGKPAISHQKPNKERLEESSPSTIVHEVDEYEPPIKVRSAADH